MEFEEVDFNNIEFNDLVYFDDTFVSRIFYNKSEKLIFYTYDVKLNQINKILDRYILELEFLSESQEFYEFMNDMDNNIISKVVDEGESIFGQKPKHDTVENLFKRSIYLPKEIKNNPTFNVILSQNFKIYDKNNEQININELKEGYRIKLKLNLVNITFKPNMYHLIYVCEEIKIVEYSSLNNNYFYDNLEKQDNYIDDELEIELANSISSE